MTTVRTLRRGDVATLAFTAAMLLPLILGGALLLWLSCARYGVGSIGLLLAAAWVWWTTGLMVKTIRGILAPEPPHLAAYRELRRRSPRVERFFFEKGASR